MLSDCSILEPWSPEIEQQIPSRMDNDFETEQVHRYTIGQFAKLNHAKVKLPGDMAEIFKGYVIPDCCREESYNNLHNIRFYPPGEKIAEPKHKPMLLRKREDAYNDTNILSSLRHAFSSVVKGSGGTVHAVAKLSQILIPETMVLEVATLFFNTIIQSPKQMPEYLTVLFSFTQPNYLERKIHFEFAKMVMSLFNNPPILKKSPLESGENRTKRHRATTCQLIASLFVYEFDPRNPSHVKPLAIFNNPEKMRERVVIPLIKEASVEVSAIKNLANVWGILTPKYEDVLARYKDDLKSIFTDARFKLTARIALKDYCEE
jgi:hypothetical protein